MISRSSWGARPPDSRSFLSSVNRVFIHYTGMDADEQENHVNCAGRVRGIQRYHMDTNGWADIAYSFIVCKHGFIFEGRGFDARTAATGPCNDDSLAVCFLGDDTANRDDVSNAGRKAIADAVASIERRKGNVSVHGHRDCMSTSCPGDQLYQWLRDGLPLPPPPPEPEDDLPYTPAELQDIMLDALETERGKLALQQAVRSIPIADRISGGVQELRLAISRIHLNSARAAEK